MTRDLFVEDPGGAGQPGGSALAPSLYMTGLRPLALLLVAILSGCADTYLVSRDELQLLANRHRAHDWRPDGVIAAQREDGERVRLPSKTFEERPSLVSAALAEGAVGAGRVQVRVTNHARSAASVLASLAAPLVISSIAIGASSQGGTDSASRGLGVAGAATLGGLAGALLVTSGILALSAKRSSETSQVARPWDAGTLAEEREKAHRLTVGGGVGVGLSLAVVLAGVGTFVNQAEGDGRLAGIGLMAVGAIALAPSFAVCMAGLGNRTRLRRSTPDGRTVHNSAPALPVVAPWASATSGGLAVAGAF